MPDAWDQFADAPDTGGDPWAQFADAPGGENQPTARAAFEQKYAGVAPGDRPPMLPEEMTAAEAAPSAAPSPFRGVRKYGQGVFEAARRVDQTRLPGQGLDVGTLEAAGSIVTGGLFAPVLGAAESAILGTDPKESFGRYTYQPRSASGKAQLGLLGAVAKPVTDSGLDIALAPLFAGESQAARVPANAPRMPVRRPAVPGSGRAVVANGAPAPRVPPAAAKAGKAGLASVPPTLAKLRAEASAAYKVADDSGVVISAESFGRFKQQAQGLLSRKGIDKDLHPDTSAALRRIVESDGNVSLQQIQTLRELVGDAKAAPKPRDRGKAMMLGEQLDNYVDSLSARDLVAGDAKKVGALKEARGYYSRLKKAEEIGKLIENATRKKNQYSASGVENALRNQFEKLAGNENKMRRFTPEEQAAIRKVAAGEPLGNLARQVGKFSPTDRFGQVSALIAMLSNPVGGAALPVVGLAGRVYATKVAKRNALAAEALMRRGPAPSPPKVKRNALVTTE